MQMGQDDGPAVDDEPDMADQRLVEDRVHGLLVVRHACRLRDGCVRAVATYVGRLTRPSWPLSRRGSLSWPRIGGVLELADMLALAALSPAVTVPTGALLSIVCALSAVAGYVERLDDLLQAEPERSGSRTVGRRVAGAVRLERASFSYSTLLPPAIEDVSLDILPGEHVAVVGASGSGKTTLALLMATLYQPSSGTVRIDGQDAREYDVEQLRRRIGVVTQSTTLFSLSIRDNITFGRSWITEDDVVAAARAAAVHDEIVGLPSGYDTRFGNAGAGLSGGQRQRLALARALAARPGLLVLDEATRALDPVTERVVQRALTELSCTRIVVAHRTSTITTADRVLVLDAGRLVANGTYASVRRRSPEFRALLEADGRLRAPASRPGPDPARPRHLS